MGGKLDGQDSPIFQPNGSSLRVHELGGRINTLYSQAYEFTAAAPFAESTINTWASITGALVTDRVSCTPKTPGRGINQVSGPDVKFEWHQGIQSVQIQLILKKQKRCWLWVQIYAHKYLMGQFQLTKFGGHATALPSGGGQWGKSREAFSSGELAPSCGNFVLLQVRGCPSRKFRRAHWETPISTHHSTPRTQ